MTQSLENREAHSASLTFGAPRRMLMTLAAYAPCAAALLIGSMVYAADLRPNIVFIFSDDHAYQAVSAYGHNLNHTPNIDRLAKEGMIFHRALVTNSICGPSRAVIQTGKYSHLNGFIQNGNRFDGSQQTMPKLMQKAGYQTAVIGKWHLETDPQGYDYWHILPGQGAYYNPPMIDNGTKVTHTGYTTDIIGDLTLDWLKNKRDADKPFLLMCQHKAPHRNWASGPKYLDKYDDVTMPEPATLFDDYSGRGTAAKIQDMSIAKTMTSGDLKLTFPPYLNDEQRALWHRAYDAENEALAESNLTGDDLVRWKYQRYIKDYLRCIDSVDENVGRVLNYLDEAGLAENTLVVYSSDQGFYLGEHGWFDKRWIYEESVRTPLVARWPGKIKPASTCESMVSNLDFPETFLDVAGAAVPSDMQGRSLTPIFEGSAPADWRKSFYYHYYEFPGAHSVQRHYGVVTDRYKLVYFYTLNEWEMYDRERDPQELHSVYADPEYAATMRDLKAELYRLRRDLAVPEDTRPVEAAASRTPGAQPRRRAAKQKAS